jgi:hypothetical protein
LSGGRFGCGTGDTVTDHDRATGLLIGALAVAAKFAYVWRRHSDGDRDVEHAHTRRTPRRARG